MMSSILNATAKILVATANVIATESQVTMYDLAHSMSTSWFQGKLQDALDMVDSGEHAPSERVVIRNANAREFRERCMRHKELDFVVIPNFEIKLKNYEYFKCYYRLGVEVRFKKYKDLLVPEVRFYDRDGKVRGKWSSYDEAFKALSYATERALDISQDIIISAPKDPVMGKFANDYHVPELTGRTCLPAKIH